MSLKRLLPLLLAGAVGVLGGTGENTGRAFAQPVGDQVAIATDLQGARDLARKAIAAGRPDLAADVARQIIATRPKDAGAHLILAAALTRAGKSGQAAKAAKTGFHLAQNRETRFEAAWLTAEALAADQQVWAAKYWLRRADLYAPTARHRAVLARGYRTLAARSRFGFSLTIFGGPSENVNGGSLHDFFDFFGVPIPIERALPGQIWGGAVQLRYRLTPTSQADLQWVHRGVVLGDRARAIDPTARSSDYSQDRLSLGFSKFWQDPQGRLAVSGGASISRSWKGGQVNADFLRTELTALRPMTSNWVLGATILLESADVPSRPIADSFTRKVEILTTHADSGLGAFSLRLGAVDVASDAAGVAWRGPTLSLGWNPPIRTNAVAFQVDLVAEQRDYWRTADFAPDERVALSVNAELKGLQFMGFNPSVTLTAARTRSEVVVRDTEEIGISFGISSNF